MGHKLTLDKDAQEKILLKLFCHRKFSERKKLAKKGGLLPELVVNLGQEQRPIKEKSNG